MSEILESWDISQSRPNLYFENGQIVTAKELGFDGTNWCNINGYDIIPLDEYNKSIKDSDLFKYKIIIRPDPTKDEMFKSLRFLRDLKLKETDKYMLPDFPINDATRENLKQYRQFLRDMTKNPLAPFDGGGENTPWPILPEIVKN